MLKINKSFCVAGVLGALAMSVNVALGEGNHKPLILTEYYVKFSTLPKRMDLARDMNLEIKEKEIKRMMKFLENIDLNPCDRNDAKYMLALLCLGYSPKSIKLLKPEQRQKVFELISNGIIGDIDIDTLQRLGYTSEEIDHLPPEQLFKSIIEENELLKTIEEAFEPWELEDTKFVDSFKDHQTGCSRLLIPYNVLVYFIRAGVIKALDVRHCNVGGKPSAFLKVLKSNSTLTCLNVSGNDIASSGAITLAEVLKVNSSLISLGFKENFPWYYNCIRDEDIATVIESLKFNSTLTSLDLSDNFGLRDKSVASLAEVLKVNSSLTSLNLSGNMIIGDTNVANLSEALKINSTLTELWLYPCDISFDSEKNTSIEVFSEALKVNKSLIVLHLERHGVDSPQKKYISLQPLAEALKKNSTLVELYIDIKYGNGDKEKEELAEVFKGNTSLVVIEVNGDLARKRAEEQGWYSNGQYALLRVPKRPNTDSYESSDEEMEDLDLESILDGAVETVLQVEDPFSRVRAQRSQDRERSTAEGFLNAGKMLSLMYQKSQNEDADHKQIGLEVPSDLSESSDEEDDENGGSDFDFSWFQPANK